jgi:hypothetical protein
MQTNHRKEQVFIVFVATKIIFIKKWKKNIIITSGYATKPKERASCQLVGCNTNELKAVTHGTSHDQYSNMVANKTKEREIV